MNKNYGRSRRTLHFLASFLSKQLCFVIGCLIAPLHIAWAWANLGSDIDGTKTGRLTASILYRLVLLLVYPTFPLLWALKPIFRFRAVVTEDSFHRRKWLRHIDDFTFKNWNKSWLESWESPNSGIDK